MEVIVLEKDVLELRWPYGGSSFDWIKEVKIRDCCKKDRLQRTLVGSYIANLIYHYSISECGNITKVSSPIQRSHIVKREIYKVILCAFLQHENCIILEVIIDLPFWIAITTTQ